MRKALSLLEILASLAVITIIIITMVTLLHASQQTLETIERELDGNSASQELLQKITEDINEFCSQSENTNLVLQHKSTPEGNLYRLEITNFFNGNANTKLIYKKVVWQSDYDINMGTFIIYRARSGMNLEDTLTSTEQQENLDKEIYVPVCTDATYFSIQAFNDEILTDSWSNSDFPAALFLSISFAPPVEYITGDIEVPEEDRLFRTVSVSRAREYNFKLVNKDLEEEYQDITDEMPEDEEDFDTNITDDAPDIIESDAPRQNDKNEDASPRRIS